MSETTTIHVRVKIFYPPAREMIAVPGVQVKARHSRLLWDKDLSASGTTDANGDVALEITYEADEVESLNPYFEITIPESARKIPANEPAKRQITLPEDWETRHASKRRLGKRLLDYTDPADPLVIYVGLAATLRLSWTDFDPSGVRNPTAIPENTLRVSLRDYDEFLFIDWLNPDDWLEGFIHNPRTDEVMAVGDDVYYPYADTYPTAPSATQNAASPFSLDPPGAPVGVLGGASFQSLGVMTADSHGFIFVVDDRNVRRFYPGGMLAETISFGGGAPFSGLAADAYDHLYVSDPGSNQVLIFRLRSGDGDFGTYGFVGSIGGAGAADGQFNKPRGLAVIASTQVDGPDYLAVADSGNQRVQIFEIEISDSSNPNGAKRVLSFPRVNLHHVQSFGSSGAALDQFTDPVDVAALPDGSLLVCDAVLHRVTRWHFTGDYRAPGGLAVSGDGKLFVSDTRGGRLWQLNTNGQTQAIYRYHGEAAGGLTGPHYVTSGGGRIVVTERLHARLQAFSPDGVSQQILGRPGEDKGELSLPGGSAVDNDGNIYVVDTGHHRIQKFSRDGRFLDRWGEEGSGATQFSSPVAVAIDNAGNIYVVDRNNNRIQKFDREMKPQARWGTKGGANGEFDQPLAIAIHNSSLYVTDSNNNRVQKFDTSGSHQLNIALTGAPYAVAVDSSDEIYVTVPSNARVYKFDALGNALTSWGVLGDDEGQFRSVAGIAVHGTTQVYVADAGTNRVQVFDSNGTHIMDWGGSATVLNEPMGIAIDSLNTVYVLDDATSRILTFLADGSPGRQWGGAGRGQGRFRSPVSAVWSGGSLFVVDQDNYRVQKLSSSGNVQKTWGSFGAANGQFDRPTGVAADSAGRIYVTDTGNHRVQKFDADGNHLASWGTFGTADGEFDAPAGIAIDTADHVLVVDAGNHRVQVFDTNGVFQSKWGSQGRRHGEFQQPFAIATDAANNVYVSDRALHTVQKFDAAHAFQWRSGMYQPANVMWGAAGNTAGSGPGEFNTPAAIAVDAIKRYAYVLDANNHRVQRFNVETNTWLADWTPAAPFDPVGLAVDPIGDVYAADDTAKRVYRATTFDAVSGAPLADGTAPAAAGTPWTGSANETHMRGPAYVHFDGQDRLWVADTENDRLLIYERGANDQRTLVASPIVGLNRPVGITHDAAGHVYVVERGAGRVQQFGTALNPISDFGSSGSGATDLDTPQGIAFVRRGSDDLLYIADSHNNRVQVFKTDGTHVKSITTDGTIALSDPHDVAVDATGHVFVADSGNARIVWFDETDTHKANILLNDHGLTFKRIAGLSIDDDNALIVTDSSAKIVYRMKRDGKLHGYWDLEALVRQAYDENPLKRRFYYPEQARHLVFNQPSHAEINARGLLAVADTGHDRVRLVRTFNEFNLVLFDLGEHLPDVTVRASTSADWREEIGLKLEVGTFWRSDFNIETKPDEDFSEDHYRKHHVIGVNEAERAAINVMKVIRAQQMYLKHITRGDEAEHRWGTEENDRSIGVDIRDIEGSHYILNVALGMKGPHTGRRGDAWDDSVVVHEMGHWLFGQTTRPNRPPYSLWGALVEISRSHTKRSLQNHNLAASEGWAEYLELFWGSEYNSTSVVRGYPITSFQLTSLVDEGEDLTLYPYGGDAANPVPAFNQPGLTQRNEGYFANTLYQLQRLMTDPEAIFAERPSYWHRHNLNATEAQSGRFASTIWRALRSFAADPPLKDIDRTSTVFMRNVLRLFNTQQPDLAAYARAIFELNNMLMPRILVFDGAEAVTEALSVASGAAKLVTVRVVDEVDAPLANVIVNVRTSRPHDFSVSSPGPLPPDARGRRTAGLSATTNASGEFTLTFTASAAGSSHVFLIYQPDFDTDGALAPPQKGDDLETVFFKSYLHKLRTVGKFWRAAGTNFGAAVSTRVDFNITS